MFCNSDCVHCWIQAGVATTTSFVYDEIHDWNPVQVNDL